MRGLAAGETTTLGGQNDEPDLCSDVMGDVTAICWLLPGAKVSVSETVVRVEHAGTAEYHDAFQPHRDLADVAQSQQFRLLLTVNTDAPRPLILVRAEMTARDGFDRRAARLLKQGAAFTTTLEEPLDLPGSDGQVDLRCDFVYVLRESKRASVLLGVLSADPENRRDHTVVGMLDLLGFSAIMDTLTLDDIERRYTQTLMGGLAFAGMSSAGALLFDSKSKLDAADDLWSVSVGVFSDTVLLYPRIGGAPLDAVCRAVAVLTDIAIQADWLFRGGIDYGSFRDVEDHTLFLGTAVTRAHVLEESQNWAGSVIGEHALTVYADDVARLKDEGLLVDYPVPFKKGKSIQERTAVAINWCYFALPSEDARREKLSQLFTAAPAGAKSKIAATIAFHEQMVARGLAAKQQVFTRVVGDPVPRQRKRRKSPAVSVREVHK